eukprot:TRINITY_DN113930_c0_g1_i1.p1 TRINITY_DN113930_c0_g1~~TRINITY_DN113930_c0_g1_i1.p1  ORF type:complete len:141 (+),score=12.90 TRINITY_DN113930_c0_g1_i1:48-425(+)
MAGRVRTRADDWGSAKSSMIGGGGTFTAKRNDPYGMNDLDPATLPAPPEKRTPNPMYKTSSQEYGANAEQAVPPAPHQWHGKAGRFTENFSGGMVCSAGLNTKMDKSRVGGNPQFGQDAYGNTML